MTTNQIMKVFDGFPSIFDSNFPQHFFDKGGSWSEFFTKDVFPYDVVVRTTDEGKTQTELVYALAGVPKEAISVKVDNNTLEIVIDDKRKDSDDFLAPLQETGVHYVHKGISHRRMIKRFTVGGGLDKDSITSKLENGLLTITIPHHADEDTSRVIDIG